MRTDRVLQALLVGASILGAPAVASAQPCKPFWSDRFASAGIPYGTIYAMTVYDDGLGRGETLYIGGGFTTAGSVTLNRIARLDGNGWAPLGLGMPGGRVFAFAVFDDGLGNGPALYAGGFFETAGGVRARGIARWDGRGWSPVGTGVDGLVSALAVFDDGSGARPALYVGGSFTSAGGVEAGNVARWDGRSWTAVGEGTDAIVRALHVFDDGCGAKLYAGGNFLVAGGTDAHHVAAWDGRGWAPLANGVDGTVRALTVVEDLVQPGPALYAAGDFTTAGGQHANLIARWDGRAWSPLGSGIAGDNVQALTVFDDAIADGPALYAGGSFEAAGGVEAGNLARFNGTSWSSVGGGLDGRVTAMHVFGDPSAGRRLYIGGSFYSAGDLEAARIAIWDGSSWSTVDRGILGGKVFDMEVFDDGSGKGPSLYAAGVFQRAGGIATASIARWDGRGWSALGSGVGDRYDGATALAAFDDGSGPALFVGGQFTHAGGVPANNIARWDGTSWRPVGGGLDGLVRALAVFDDGSGPALYAGGWFQTAGGRPAPLIARWDGKTWSDVGGGLSGKRAQVRALLVHDDGTGPALFAAGLFDSAGGIDAANIARWNGKTWAPLAQGVQGLGNSGGVFSLGIYDDGRGDGPVLLAGGYFTAPDGAEFRSPARWDGRAWAPLAKGVIGTVYSFATYDDGLSNRPALYLGGLGGWIHRYDGRTLSHLGDGLDGPAAAMEVFDDGSGDGPSLFVGGDFDYAGGILSLALSVWVACPGFVLGDLDGDGTVGHGDLKLLLGAWGPCPDCDNCLADLDGDCSVAVPDLLTLLANWGLTK